VTADGSVPTQSPLLAAARRSPFPTGPVTVLPSVPIRHGRREPSPGQLPDISETCLLPITTRRLPPPTCEPRRPESSPPLYAADHQGVPPPRARRPMRKARTLGAPSDTKGALICDVSSRQSRMQLPTALTINERHIMSDSLVLYTCRHRLTEGSRSRSQRHGDDQATVIKMLAITTAMNAAVRAQKL
jgi:hypothetical protein